MDLCDIWTNISETVNAMSNVSMKDTEYEVIYDISVYLPRDILPWMPFKGQIKVTEF